MNHFFIFGTKLILIFMKHLLFLVALLPFFVCAQSDPKYLEGSVPVVDGKVVFQKNIQLASNSGAEAFQLAKA